MLCVGWMESPISVPLLMPSPPVERTIRRHCTPIVQPLCHCFPATAIGDIQHNEHWANCKSSSLRFCIASRLSHWTGWTGWTGLAGLA